jgi:hypothetical protein
MGLLRRLRVAVDATPEWRLCRAGSVYRSVLSQAGTPIQDATMRKIAAGLATSLGDASEPPRGLAIAPPEPAGQKGYIQPELRTLMSGLVFGEQPRWHEDRLWFSDWGTQDVIAVDLDGNPPACRGVIVSMAGWCLAPADRHDQLLGHEPERPRPHSQTHAP